MTRNDVETARTEWFIQWGKEYAELMMMKKDVDNFLNELDTEIDELDALQKDMEKEVNDNDELL